MAVQFLVSILVVLASAGALSSVQNSTTVPSEPNLYETLKAGNQACLEGSYISCVGTCIIFNNFGILDKEGRYVESKMVDYVATGRKLNQEEKNQTINACRSVNTTTETGCELARRVFKCLADYKLKEPSIFDMMAFGNQQCIEKNVFMLCYTVCLTFKSFGIIDINEKYVESELVKLMANGGGISQEQANQAALTCRSVNGTDTCEQVRGVLKCISDHKLKVTAEQMNL